MILHQPNFTEHKASQVFKLWLILDNFRKLAYETLQDRETRGQSNIFKTPRQQNQVNQENSNTMPY